MNTKLVLTFSAIVFGVSGIALTFAPDLIAPAIHIDSGKSSQLLLQIIGGLYFGLAMLNWMAKGSLIGGIYNRPIAVANFTHCMISGLAVLKGLNSDHQLPVLFWAAGIIYLVLGVSFGIILFRHPVQAAD